MQSLKAILEEIDAGRVSEREALAASRRAILANDATIGAFEYVADLPEGEPQGPLAGIAIGVKDVFNTADLPTAYGSAVFAGYRPAMDAALVALARERGAQVAGKTVTTEFAFLNPARTVNPCNPAHTPGGSSSGSAAAVAAGLVPAAFGTQTGGSVIGPQPIAALPATSRASVLRLPSACSFFRGASIRPAFSRTASRTLPFSRTACLAGRSRLDPSRRLHYASASTDPQSIPE